MFGPSTCVAQLLKDSEMRQRDGMSREGSLESLCAEHGSTSRHFASTGSRGPCSPAVNSSSPNKEVQIPNHSIELQKMTNEEGGFTFSCTLRASQTNLLGLALINLPGTRSFQDLATCVHEGTTVTRNFKVTVSPRACYRPPRRTALFCSWLLWFVTTASAAALVAFGVPVLRDALHPNNALLRGRPRAASLDRVAHWDTAEAAASPFSGGPFEGATSDVAWKLKDAGGKMLRPLTTLFEPEALAAHAASAGRMFEPETIAAHAASAGRMFEPEALAARAASAGRMFEPEALAAHAASAGRMFEPVAARAASAGRTIEHLEQRYSPLISPLAAGSTEDHGARHSFTEDASKPIPPLPVGAIGFANAVATVLGSCIEPPTPDVASLAGVADGLSAAGGVSSAAGCAYLASCVRAPAVSPPPAPVDNIWAVEGTDERVVDVDRSLLAARLAMRTYHSCDAPNETETIARLAADLAHDNLSLVGNVNGNQTLCDDTNAYVAANASHMFVVFRGSCSLKNALTDIQYHDDGQAARALEAATGMALPAGMRLHRGFANAYLSVRAELMALLQAEAHRAPDAVRPVLAIGHSMGGAMAMLAALELESIRQTGAAAQEAQAGGAADDEDDASSAIPLCLGHVSSLVFGCPRVGDATFAEHFNHHFPGADDYCALQASNDAIPHLPFMSWGFRHPAGSVRLAPSAPATPRRANDPGDSVEFLRPREGEIRNWVTCHDLNEYVALLHGLPTEGGDRAAPSQAVDAVSGGSADDAEWGI